MAQSKNHGDDFCANLRSERPFVACAVACRQYSFRM
jgi:hypothetical protein